MATHCHQKDNLNEILTLLRAHAHTFIWTVRMQTLIIVARRTEGIIIQYQKYANQRNVLRTRAKNAVEISEKEKGGRRKANKPRDDLTLPAEFLALWRGMLSKCLLWTQNMCNNKWSNVVVDSRSNVCAIHMNTLFYPCAMAHGEDAIGCHTSFDSPFVFGSTKHLHWILIPLLKRLYSTFGPMCCCVQSRQKRKWKRRRWNDRCYTENDMCAERDIDQGVL